MRILLTNNTLGDRAGTENYIADISLGLRARGHQLIAYSQQLGLVAEELRALGLIVVDDLNRVSEPPDVIHGQHHLETMTALHHFPNTPAVYTLHGGAPWLEYPPRFPRILRYLTVGDVGRDRLVLEHGIPARMTAITRNAVNLDTFLPRPTLPDRPGRALVFANEATLDGWVVPIRAACDAAGIMLDVAGTGSGSPLRRPWEVLGTYDLVFARGRAALEALAIGTAVIVVSSGRLGPMVVHAERERGYSVNFGISLVDQAMTEAAVTAEIARYDPTDAAAVSAWIRQVAGLDALVEQLLDLYGEVIAEYEGQAEAPARCDEHQDTARYLARLSPYLKGRDREVQTSLDELRRYAQSLEQERDRLQAALVAEQTGHADELAAVRAYADSLERDRDELAAVLEHEQTEREHALTELQAYASSLEQDREAQAAAFEQERAEREQTLAELQAYVGSLEQDREAQAAAWIREREEQSVALERERTERTTVVEREREAYDRNLRDLRAHVNSLEGERDARAAALEQERREREQALAELQAYARSLEHEREERETALERERAEREAALHELQAYARSLEHDREEREMALAGERAEHASGLAELQAYARSLEREREERASPLRPT